MLYKAICACVFCLEVVVLFHTLLHFIPFLSSVTQRLTLSDDSILSMFTIDALHSVMFIGQHSILASTTFKSILEHLGLSELCRALYVVSTSIVLQVMIRNWQSIPEVYLWYVDLRESLLLANFFLFLHCVFWTILAFQILAACPLYHFGFAQILVTLDWQERRNNNESMLHQLLSRLPHPGGCCFISILWCHPHMTFDRMIIATVFTSYLCVGMDTNRSDVIRAQNYHHCKKTRTVYKNF
ncbi:nurim homolog [Dreissena polymorpha]|uniref:Nuclear envelope membrane protein n=1 Tax=Dreissena polymorpha TaxID=45954 RepID=A0A9D4ND12_DREPO|nr:nurim homolog [Dreissena polymorpha]KAH3891027.1 hypothetical protein DPMN_015118 [Dreissena polymorpha]